MRTSNDQIGVGICRHKGRKEKIGRKERMERMGERRRKRKGEKDAKYLASCVPSRVCALQETTKRPE